MIKPCLLRGDHVPDVCPANGRDAVRVDANQALRIGLHALPRPFTRHSAREKRSIGVGYTPRAGQVILSNFWTLPHSLLLAYFVLRLSQLTYINSIPPVSCEHHPPAQSNPHSRASKATFSWHCCPYVHRLLDIVKYMCVRGPHL